MTCQREKNRTWSKNAYFPFCAIYSVPGVRKISLFCHRVGTVKKVREEMKKLFFALLYPTSRPKDEKNSLFALQEVIATRFATVCKVRPSLYNSAFD